MVQPKTNLLFVLFIQLGRLRLVPRIFRYPESIDVLRCEFVAANITVKYH